MEEIRREVFVGRQRFTRFERFEYDEYASSYTRPVLDQYRANITGAGVVRNTAEDLRFDHLNCRDDEGPLRYDSNQLYFEHKLKTKHRNPGYVLDEPARFEGLETDRAELIRKLDELKDTLARSWGLTEKPEEKRFSPARTDLHRIGRQGTSLGHESARFPANSRHSYPRQWPHEVISYKLEAPCSWARYCGNNNVNYNSNRHCRESATLNYCQSSSRGSHGEKLAVPKKRDRPIAGGAPIISCSNCFELLKLPKKLTSPARIQQKMKCGSCSSIILFVSSVFDEVHEDCNTKDECNNKLCRSSSDSRACCNDASDLRFSTKEEKKSSCSFEFRNGKTLENMPSAPKYDCKMSALPLTTGSESPANLDLFCQEISDRNFNEQRIQRPEFEEKVDVDESRQNSLHEEEFDWSKATEINVSLTELPNTSISHESEETMDISSVDFTNPDPTSRSLRSNVFVNGHLIPEHKVKKAEKLAGPIRPGEYWYDSVAGFWGVMGHPCLGILMPNIEEFNYPMAESCAAGNTGIYVNGRELYEKDMDLLTGRGLPHTRNRSYIIYMSGKVINEQTGQELDSLGKLAPSVEKAGRGFGMKVPRFIARSQIQ